MGFLTLSTTLSAREVPSRLQTAGYFLPSGNHSGSYLRSKPNDQNLADKYCYDSLYSLTKSGAQQYPDKNRALFPKAFTNFSGGSEISPNALNVPQGSVRVTAGGIPDREC
ncbi:MAG: hypothetical protein IPH20_16465 [Bacteroidales bacterium]|nr:hypothetical protein [Bacteroidales bacterium]